MHTRWLTGRSGRNILLRTQSVLWRNAGRSAHQLRETVIKIHKLLFTYVVVFCVKLRTFRTPRHKVEFLSPEIDGRARGLYSRRTVSYTHLTLPTNREV